MRRLLLLLIVSLASYAVLTALQAHLLGGVEQRAGYADAAGNRLYCLHWLPSASRPRGTTVLFHGLGGQGLAGYLLVITYVSLLLLLPLDAMAQVWAREGGSWVDNATWLAATESLLLSSVTLLV
ncbi:MAG: hypothetical protein B7L53_09485 [Thermofilum sp. NZ13]|nr:MAG: hypothetical protein B7L53_09485 [Thermofilum sp. NZ13]